MTRNKDSFSDLEDKGLQMHIEMGDDGRYNTINIGIVIFQRDFGSPLILKYVMYVLGLKNNLVLVSMLQYHGYDVILSQGKVLLRHITTSEVINFDVLFKNLYALQVQDSCKALRIKAKVRDLVVDREHESPLNMQHKQVVEQPQLEKQRGDRVQTSTLEETSRRGKF